MDFISVYMTTPSEEEAGAIGRSLVEDGLAACVNILPGMTSIYRWEGTVEQASEVVLIAKTQAELFDALSARVRALHSYECPCILGLPVLRGAPAYLDWIAGSTVEAKAGS